MIQLLNAATLQQINEKKEEEENKKIISVGEKSVKDVKMKKIIKKNFRKKKKISIQ